jgi:PadR family transcriptional regulator PadR
MPATCTTLTITAPNESGSHTPADTAWSVQVSRDRNSDGGCSVVRVHQRRDARRAARRLWYRQSSTTVDSKDLSTYYLLMTDINTRALDRELKRGSAELLILSLLDARPRHGYELSKLIHTRSGGQLTFHIDSLYPLLYRLEERGWIKGTWVEKPDERRRRFYRVTPEGRRVLAQQRKTWAAFVEAVRRVTGDEHA